MGGEAGKNKIQNGDYATLVRTVVLSEKGEGLMQVCLASGESAPEKPVAAHHKFLCERLGTLEMCSRENKNLKENYPSGGQRCF